MLRFNAFLITLLAIGGVTASAQDATTAGALTLDVVSVKAATEASSRRLAWTPGRFTGGSIPFVGLVNMAYGGGTPVRLEGGDAMRLTMWDVELTFQPAVEATPEQRAQMLRSVLEDRFHLTLRRESREMEVYALTLARADGTLGPQFHRSELPCDSPNRARFAAMPATGQRPGCGALGNLQTSSILAGDATIEQITRGLSAGRPIVDRTGLTGKFDIVLTYAMDTRLPLPAGVEQPPAPTGLPSLFTALVEQAGLKLEPTRAPVDVYVVVRLEPPAPN